jgi:DNA polymerase-1
MNQGFFNIEKKKSIKNKTAKNKTVKSVNCDSCGFDKTCSSPKMEIYGKGKKSILVIGTAPTGNEDKSGEQLTGESGKKLKAIFRDAGISISRDCFKTNALLCNPPKGKKIGNNNINACRRKLLHKVKKYKPEKIITLGATALQALIGDRVSVGESALRWTGWKIPDQDLKCWIYPTYDIQQLIKNPQDKALQNIFINNIQDAINHDEEFPDYSEDKKCVEILRTPYEACLFIDSIQEKSNSTIDIEATGSKPHYEKQELVTMSIAIGENRSVVFPFFDDRKFRISVKKYLKNPKKKKTAHNLKYEDSWLSNKLKCPVRGWYWDTMVVAHILDNRRKITSLDDQVYFNFGISDYSSHIKNYLIPKEKGAKQLNNIHDLDIDELLLYNGLDTLYTHRLKKVQSSKMSIKDFEAYGFFHEGLEELAVVEKNGMAVNIDYYNKKYDSLLRKMSILDKKILNSPEVEVWEKKKDKKKFAGKIFDYNSSVQLKSLLFDILDYESIKKTKKGNDSVDKEALENMDHIDFVKYILQWRKLDKLRNTYLIGFMREEVDGRIHPVFNLNMAKTYRPSTKDPNLANVPKHEEKAQKLCRTGLTPSKGNILFEVDYSSIEVKVGACYHKDPAMIKYILDPSSDMHRDAAIDLFKTKNIDGRIRFLAKNNFVFAEFYGDWYKSCAESLWKNMDDYIKEGVKDRGLTNYTKFENHVKKVEDILWKRFSVYDKWRKDKWKFYQKYGYTESLTGFTCRAYSTRNEVTNQDIQGSAFHCTLWSLIQINKYLRENKHDTKIINQIYDSIIFDMVPDEKEELKPVITRIMTEDIREKWKWIIVPLTIDMEESEIDGNWYQMNKVK